MAKKLYKDAVFLAPAAGLAALAAMLTDPVFMAGQTEDNLLRTNLITTLPDDQGNMQEVPALGYDDTGALVLMEPEKAGALGIVIRYHLPETPGALIPQAEGEPLLKPQAVYLLNLPSAKEILSSPKLEKARQDMITARLLAVARKLAKDDAEGKAPLVVDRIAAFLAAASRSSGASAEKVYVAMFPKIQGAILDRAAKVSAAMAAAKNFAAKRAFDNTYSRGRLNKDTLRECFASVEAAEFHFPAMPQEQWENMLKFAIALAPKFRVDVLVKDEAGKNIKRIDPETGKETLLRETKEFNLSPAIFQQWLATRADAKFDQAADPLAGALTFEGMTA